MDSFSRTSVTPERARELDKLVGQLAFQLPSDLSECLYVRDVMDQLMQRWVDDARAGKAIVTPQPIPKVPRLRVVGEW